MKTLRLGNLTLFGLIYPYSWLGASLISWQRGVVCEVCVGTVEIGFEYVWRNRKWDAKTRAVGFSWDRIARD